MPHQERLSTSNIEHRFDIRQLTGCGNIRIILTDDCDADYRCDKKALPHNVTGVLS